jgi:hypothetical protein
MAMIEQFPIIITVRDRLSPLTALLDWLEAVGQQEIWLCDNASTYPPLVNFLATTKYHVVRNGFNLGKRAPWLSGLVPELGHHRYFVVTDPDIVPTTECPHDALAFFKRTLEERPEIYKVGFSLKIDDLPDHYRHKQSVIDWEQQFWAQPVFQHYYYAPIDTTFAMYRPGMSQSPHQLRTAPPYEARHLPWYQNSDQPTEDEMYYAAHVDSQTKWWTDGRLPGHVRGTIRALKSDKPASSEY